MLNNILKKFLILATSLLLVSCATRQIDAINEFGVAEQDQEQVLAANFPYNYVPLNAILMDAFVSEVPQQDAEAFAAWKNNLLENDFDGKEAEFIALESDLKAKLKLNNSFKLVEQNIYCREYLQDVEYMGEKISHTAVACRVKKAKWQDLRS